MKHGMFMIGKKNILSAVGIVAVGCVLAGGSVYADKNQPEEVVVVAEAQAERQEPHMFVPVETFGVLETELPADSIPVFYAKADAETFGENVKTDIEEKAAKEAEEKAEREAAEKAAREAEEGARQEAAQAEASQKTEVADKSESTDGSADASQSESADNSGTVSASRDVSCLYKYVGCQYVWSGASPSGWDCSGFVMYVMKNEFGVIVDRTCAGQAGNGYAISVSERSQWQPGDLLLYRNSSGNFGHVGIYLGNGQMIHALSPERDTFTQSVSQYEGWDSNTLSAVRRVLN